MNKKILITLGDINGIGPEITVKALNELNLPQNTAILVTSKKVLDFYAQNFNLQLKNPYEIIEVDIDLKAFDIGKENKFSGDFSFHVLKKACEAASKNLYNIVTAPISKYSLNLAGHNFSGQTEILENFLAKKNQKTEMLFISDNFRIMLLTRHIPIAKVSSSITKTIFEEKVLRLNNFLKNKCKIVNPKIAICALNPHAGENGLLGDEEKNILIPVIEKLNKNGLNLSLPLVADALFAQTYLQYQNQKFPYDCYIAMYHDQGLIPMKAFAQKSAVNTTIGLDIIRTSPSHGTAFDIAGKNKASEKSMIAAIKIAANL